jgi:hypothetical protein
MSKLLNFPSINCISLQESADRRSALLEQFKKYGIKNINFLISNRLNDTKDCYYEGEFVNYVCIQGISTVLNHLKNIKLWYENTTEPYAFFCEDDISLETVEYWNFTWLDFIKSLPYNWECIQLHTVATDEELMSWPEEIRFEKRCIYNWSAAGFIITRQYAKKIIDSYCIDNKFILNIKQNPFWDKGELFKYPYPENTLFTGHGKVYTIPLFVENTNFYSTFTKEPHHKGGHLNSYNRVLKWWQNNGSKINLYTIMNKQDLFNNFALDSESPEINFELGRFYDVLGHTASASSHYLRCAERSENLDLVYTSFILMFFCYMSQGGRNFTAEHLLHQAIHVLPKRPEAYYLLSRFYERTSEWYKCYMFANLSLQFCEFDLPELSVNVEYPGKYGLIYEKAVACWYWDKIDEGKELFLDLKNNFVMDKAHQDSVNYSLKELYKIT